MIKAEIRFKNSAFSKALQSNGYKSIMDFSRKSDIPYSVLISYANLEHIFEGSIRNIDINTERRNIIISLLKSDEWTLFEQYRELIEKKHGVKKITTEIPINKVVSLEDKSLLLLESENDVDQSMVQESLQEDIAAALSTLGENEAKVLQMHYGLGNTEALDLDLIAEEIGLTRERVRQIKEKGVRRLRHRDRSRKLRWYIKTIKE